MLVLLVSATPSLSLSHAESRVGCEARRSFCAAVSSPSARAFELALLLAAEERPSEDVADISSEVDVIVNALAEKARSRLQLETLVGGDPKDPQCIAAATSRVLFGSEGAGEDDDEAFFSGSSQADYYDPRNSYLDAVLERRQGIPITLSLVYAEVCERLGLQMVGLNAPSHLLIAPADRDVPFVVDPFAGGAILSTDSAAQLVTTNANLGNPDKGRILLKSLRARPMTAQMWASRMLRNLRANHAEQEDVVRTLGAAERLRLVSLSSPGASTPLEQLDCKVQLAYCVWRLRWEERRDEARALLQELTADERVPVDDRAQLTTLLEDEWWS